MTPVEILKDARELISVPERWTQGANARTKKGMPIGSAEHNAVCWCALGAIGKNSLPSSTEKLEAICFLVRQIDVAVSAFNDEHTHPEVVALFDRAIAAAEAQ